jgi:glycosyltransferase involved in cell wall biosynthesis
MDTQRKLSIFLATSGHSGVDRIMKNLIPAFAAKGLRVDLLHVGKHGPYLDHVPENVRIVELGTSHIYSSLGPVSRYLQSERPYAMLSDKDRVNRVALLAKRFAKVSTRIAVRTGTTVSKDLEGRGLLDRWAHYFSMHCMYAWADAIIVPSHGAAEDLARFAGIPFERISVVPSPAVTMELYELIAERADHPWFNQGNTPVILGAGELCARKDFATLIRAFAKVVAHRPCRLVILGEGRKRKALIDLALQLGLGKEVSLPGFVKNPYAYMRKAALFVLSSNCEGAPVVLMEALAVGIPVVSTDCPSGPREILQDGRYGRLVPIGDVAAMAKAISDTLDNPPEGSFLKQAAKPFTLDASIARYLEVLGFTSITTGTETSVTRTKTGPSLNECCVHEASQSPVSTDASRIMSSGGADPCVE